MECSKGQRKLFLLVISLFLSGILHHQDAMASSTETHLDASSLQNLVNDLYTMKSSVDFLQSCFVRTKEFFALASIKGDMETPFENIGWAAQLSRADCWPSFTDSEWNDTFIWNLCLIVQNLRRGGETCKDLDMKLGEEEQMQDPEYVLKSATKFEFSQWIKFSVDTVCKMWLDLENYRIPALFKCLQDITNENNKTTAMSLSNELVSERSSSARVLKRISSFLRNFFFPRIEFISFGLSLFNLFATVALSYRISGSSPGPTGPAGPIGPSGPTGPPGPPGGGGAGGGGGGGGGGQVGKRK